MNEHVKKLWLDALRSGEYKQTMNRLMGTDEVGNKSYCCLGVLCDLYIAENPSVQWMDNGMPITAMPGERYADNGVPPLYVLDWAGIDEGLTNAVNLPEGAEGLTPTEWDGDPYCLSQQNDAGKTFKEIADLIERFL